MTLQEAIQILLVHQAWRLGADIEMAEPKVITEALDVLLNYHTETCKENLQVKISDEDEKLTNLLFVSETEEELLREFEGENNEENSKTLSEKYEEYKKWLNEITEISDEEIKKQANIHGYEEHSFFTAATSNQKRLSWIAACKWYRKQLKSRVSL